MQKIDSVTVYYPPALAVKEGFSQIRIVLKKFLLVSWLELEGAKAIANYN